MPKSKVKQSERTSQVVPAMVAILLALFGLLAWQWAGSLRLTGVEFSGMHHAQPVELTALTHLENDSLLLDIDPVTMADRVRRHPWVKEAQVSRRFTGVVDIEVEERMPVILVLDVQGVPAYYLDVFGFQMPLDSVAVYDLPLLRGFKAPYQPTQAITHPTLKALLPALANLDFKIDALISEIVLTRDGEAKLYTTPIDKHGPIHIQLGRNGFERKFKKLYAFWHQAILTQPEKVFGTIDLRFDGQVVVRG